MKTTIPVNATMLSISSREQTSLQETTKLPLTLQIVWSALANLKPIPREGFKQRNRTYKTTSMREEWQRLLLSLSIAIVSALYAPVSFGADHFNVVIVNYGNTNSPQNVYWWPNQGCGTPFNVFTWQIGPANVGVSTYTPSFGNGQTYPTIATFGYNNNSCSFGPDLANNVYVTNYGSSFQSFGRAPNYDVTVYLLLEFDTIGTPFRHSQSDDYNDRGNTEDNNDNGGGCKPGQFCSNPCRGMPEWGVSQPYISLWLHDEPLGYQPALGPRVSFKLGFNQREGGGLYGTNFFGAFSTNFCAGYNTNFFSTGVKWNCSWSSFVTQDPNTNNVVHFSDGGLATFYSTNDFLSNGRLTGDTTNGFILSYPDGRQDVYGLIVTNSSNVFQEAFLTQRKDPQTHAITLTYYSYNPTNPVIRLKNVVDGDGRTNLISYVTSNARSTNLISRVTDPFGRTTSLFYDSNGHLTNITDVQGLSTSLAYDGNDWVTNMVTPYGATSFQLKEAAAGNAPPNGRSALITRPDGSRELFLYTNGAPGIASSYSSGQVPDTSSFFGNTLDNSNLDQHNTFHWGPRQYAALSTNVITSFTTNDFHLAHMRHWLQYVDGISELFVGSTLSMERDPSPDGTGLIEGQKTWYDYAGKTNNGYQGTQSQPLLVARVLPDGTTSFVRNERNSFGNVTNQISTYSSVGGIALRTNAFSYDATVGIDLITATNALGIQISSNMYNAYHQVATNFDALNQLTVFAYNTNQQVISVASPSGLIETNIYGADNWLATNFAYAIEGGSPVYFATNTFAYANDLVFSHTDGRGLTTTNTWDNLERLTSLTFPDGTFVTNTYAKLDLVRTIDRMSFTNLFAYDSLQRLIAETNALANVTLHGYCSCGSLSSTTNALQQVTQYFYDNQGNLTNTLYPDGYSVTANFNLLGQVTNKTDSAGVSVTNWFNNQGLQYTSSNYFGQGARSVFDILDRVTSAIDANGVTITSTYDNLNRPLVRGYPDGGSERFLYSARGLVLYTNQLTNVTAYGYDAALRKLVETNANQEITRYSYDAAGNLTSLTDGKNQITSWNYDAYGRKTNKVDATATEILRYSYDIDSRLTNRWSIAKSNTVYSYDSVGNLTNVIYHVSPSITLAYDRLNRLTNMVDGVGTTRYTYNIAGQLLSDDGPWSDDVITYGYTGRLRTSLGLQQPNADAWVQTYAYDGARRLTNITSTAGSFGYAYDSVRQMLPAKLALPNTAYITNTFDSVARLLSTIMENGGNTILNSHQYGYNVGNQRTQQVFTATNFINYAYDAIGQLTNATGKEAGGVTNRLNEQLAYGYDKAHNLQTRTNNVLIQTFNANNLNELTTANRTGTLTVEGTTTSKATSVNVNSQAATLYSDQTFAKAGFTPADGNNTYTAVASDSFGRSDTSSITVYLPATNSYSYDGNGNLLSDGTRNFAYDDENQLISVWVTNVWRSDFVYDGKMRRRIRKELTWQTSTWIQTNEVRYIYNGDLVIQERDVNNLPLISYTRASSSLLARTDHTILNSQSLSPNTHAYYHTDGNGNITALINGLQLIVAKYEYDPFGNTLSKCGPLADANTHQFASQELHLSSGLIYFGRRFYEPNLQRWLNRDPIEESGGVNLYAYAGNNAIGLRDFMGLCYDDYWTAYWLGVGNDFADVGNNLFDMFVRVPVDTAQMAYYSVFDDPGHFNPWSMTYQNAFQQDPELLQLNMLAGTVKMEANIPLWGIPALGEATLDSATSGSAAPLQNFFAGAVFAGALARFGVGENTPTVPAPGDPNFVGPVSPGGMGFGGGTVFTHFTDGTGVEGITGVPANTLASGQTVSVGRLSFGMGSNPFLASAAGDIFVTDLPATASPGELNGIGVFGTKQSFAIQFSQEAALLNNVTPVMQRPGIFTIPGGTQMQGTFQILAR